MIKHLLLSIGCFCCLQLTAQAEDNEDTTIYLFAQCTAIVEKVGSNLYLSVYDNNTKASIIGDNAIFISIDTVKQIILFDDLREESELSYSNTLPKDTTPDFSVYDIRKNKKSYAIDPFVKCNDPYYGGVGSRRSIKIERVSKKKIYLRYQDCRTSIDR